jgi:hypothetical protein
VSITEKYVVKERISNAGRNDDPFLWGGWYAPGIEDLVDVANEEVGQKKRQSL